MSSEPSPSTPLGQARDIVYNDRRKDYGSPAENHGRTAKMWSAYLGKEISARDVCMLNILQKVSRDQHGRKLDNLVDIAGYAENAYLVERPDFSYDKEEEAPPLPAKRVGLQKLMSDREFSEWIQAVQQVLKSNSIDFSQASQTAIEGVPTCTFVWREGKLTGGVVQALLTILNRDPSSWPAGWTNVTLWGNRKVTVDGEEIE